MYFDRWDICAAWNLYLQHTYTGQGCWKYERLCRLQSFYRPSLREEHVSGLSENALSIYENLMRGE